MSENQLAQPVPYVKFEDLEFITDNQKIACRELYKMIEMSKVELAKAEEAVYLLVEKIGRDRAMAFSGNVMMQKYNMIRAMEITFWNMTGINACSILINLDDNERKELYGDSLV